MNIIIKDETFDGKIINEISISFKKEELTVKDVIEQRVTSEVMKYNEKLTGFFNGLIEPTDAEKAINGYKIKANKKVDVEKQVYVALDAYMKNKYFILIDNIQAEKLEQQLILKNTTTISFIKLTPLIGG